VYDQHINTDIGHTDMTITLTAKETEAFTAWVNDALDAMGGESAADLHDDNFSWMSAPDLVAALKWSKHEVSGIMSALDAKGLIEDSGESARGARQTDWSLTSKGIDLAVEMGL
jgi:uncharacterized protein YfdQ (DUF2303 family)